MNFYQVIITAKTGAIIQSRICQTLRAARNAGKWTAKQPWVLSVSIYKGGAGGQLMDTFAA